MNTNLKQTNSCHTRINPYYNLTNPYYPPTIPDKTLSNSD